MATRLPYNTRIDYDVLDRIAQGEAYLRDALPGNVRLRLHGGIARLEVDNEAFARLLDRRADVVRRLKGLGFTYVTLDLEGFRSGSMDVGITEVHGSADPSGGVPL